MTWAVIGLLRATIKLKILMKQSTIKELSDENEYDKNYAHQELSKKKIYPIFIHSTYFQAQTSLPLIQSTKKLTFAGSLPFFFPGDIILKAVITLQVVITYILATL